MAQPVHTNNPQIASGSYPVYPSTFQLIEQPLYYLNGKMNDLYYKPWEPPSFNEQVEKMSHYEYRLVMGMWQRVKIVDINTQSKQKPSTTSQKPPATFQTLYQKFVKPWIKPATRVGQSVLIPLTTAAVTPPIVCLTVVTIVADVLIGLGEAYSAYRQGYDKKHVYLVLQKKCIAAPLQQLTFFAITTVFTAAIGLSYVYQNPDLSSLRDRISVVWFCGALFGVFVYRIVQSEVGSFPNWLKPENFNIFINGGAPNEFGETFTAKAEKKCREYQRTRKTQSEQQSSSQPSTEKTVDPWTKFIDDGIAEYGEKIKECREYKSDEGDTLSAPTNSPSNSAQFYEFLDSFIHKENPLKLLGLSSPYTTQNVRKAYISWARVLSPDQPINNTSDKRKLMSSILFRALCEARCILDPEFAPVPTYDETQH